MSQTDGLYVKCYTEESEEIERILVDWSLIDRMKSVALFGWKKHRCHEVYVDLSDKSDVWKRMLTWDIAKDIAVKLPHATVHVRQCPLSAYDVIDVYVSNETRQRVDAANQEC